MLKDMFDKSLNVGDRFVHPGRASSSCWNNVYKAVEINGNKIKCLTLTPRNGYWQYKKWDGSNYRDMTPEERKKVDMRTVTISTFGSNSVILGE